MPFIWLDFTKKHSPILRRRSAKLGAELLRDDAAQKALPKDIPLFAQHEEDAQLIRSQGFKDVRVVTDAAEFGGVKITKTGGQHGTDEMYAGPAFACTWTPSTTCP